MKEKIRIHPKEFRPFVQHILSKFKPGIDDAPVLCQADEQTATTWYEGQKAAKQVIVEKFCETLALIENDFDKELFRDSCRYRLNT